MSAPYWGQLPPVNITRRSSLKRPENSNRFQIPDDLTVETGSNRYSAQPQYPVQPQSSRQDRYSIQTTHTDAPTVSTQSPFVSPTASSFRGDGLAPRPPSFGNGVPEGGYNRDYLEKRRRRESRNRELYEENPAPPPAAPDAPRPPPPVSYKQNYNSGAPQSARSAQRATGPVGSQRNRLAENQRGQYPVDERGAPARRSSKGKEAERKGDVEWDRSKPERLDTVQPRKNSLSQAEDKRRREWALDRSPLQRLELTLDSITKEEKRARVEEAELAAREAKAGRGGDREIQASVRFRNRPIAKATPETVFQTEPQNLSEVAPSGKLSNQQKNEPQRSGTIETKRLKQVENFPADPPSDFGYQLKPEVLPDPQKPKRERSIRGNSVLPVATAATGAVGATSLAHSGSNRLKKDPPGDPWFNRRADAEKTFREVVAPRRPSVQNQQQENAPVAGATRGSAFASNPQNLRGKELQSAPNSGDLGLKYPDGPDSDDEVDEPPMRRGSTRKVEQLTGQKVVRQAPRPIPPSQQQNYARRPSQNANVPPGAHQAEREIRTKLITVNGMKYAIPPNAVGDASDAGHQGRLSNLWPPGRNQAGAGTDFYVPSRRLDEWKKGGVALLAGDLLDLGEPEKTEAEKDKTWWEAGNIGNRRKGSSKQRKAEAYDGEYDDSNGKVTPISEPIVDLEEECEGCVLQSNEH